MFGNLIRECGVLNLLAETARTTLTNLITILLGITISFTLKAQDFVLLKTLMILAIGLVAFIFDTAGGILFVKILNLFCSHWRIIYWNVLIELNPLNSITLRNSINRTICVVFKLCNANRTVEQISPRKLICMIEQI